MTSTGAAVVLEQVYLKIFLKLRQHLASHKAEFYPELDEGAGRQGDRININFLSK